MVNPEDPEVWCDTCDMFALTGTGTLQLSSLKMYHLALQKHAFSKADSREHSPSSNLAGIHPSSILESHQDLEFHLGAGIE